jgi:methylmalonyl-CoA/ethylmalonyl-CoA epimerase
MDCVMSDGTVPSTTPTITQIALVVRDLDTTMEAYRQAFGWEPWTVYEIPAEMHREAAFRGVPRPNGFRMGMTTVGGLDFELIEPLEGDSPFRDFLDQKGEGLHHIMVRAPDGNDLALRATLDREGLPFLLSGLVGGISYAYHEDPALKTIIETFDLQDPDVPIPSSTYPPTTLSRPPLEN